MWNDIFVYKDQWLPYPKSYLSADEKAKLRVKPGESEDPMVDKNYPVLKRLLVQEIEGRPTWTIVRDCPQSSRDKPSVASSPLEPMNRPRRASRQTLLIVLRPAREAA